MEDFMAELKRQPIWFLWQWKSSKPGKQTKVPLSAHGGPTGTSAVWTHTWVTYDEAVAAVEIQHAAGVGFKVPEGYFFFDADDYTLENPFIQTILKRFNSYTERSVSGGGIHIYGKCDFSKLPIVTDKDGKPKLDKAYYSKNPHNRLELYIGGLTNRFAVFTGDVVWEQPLKECTAAVLTTLEKNMRRSEKQRYSESRGGDKPTFDLICNLRKQKNGAKFKKLFDDGDVSDYGSRSEADAALCALLAFRTGPDPAAIDELFRQSALYREKWEREDYREATIRCGIDACGGEYHRSKMPHPYFIKFNEETGQPYVSVPLLAKYVRQHLWYVLVRDNGKQGLLKYVYEDGCYRLYSSDMFLGAIKQYIADYDEELVKMSKVNEALQHITTDLSYISQDDLNGEENIINFRNGLLKVTATETTLLTHSPSILSTIQIPAIGVGRKRQPRSLTAICIASPMVTQLFGACYWSSSVSASPTSKAGA